jgi:fibronectin type 3 domain-containing protein
MKSREHNNNAALKSGQKIATAIGQVRTVRKLSRFHTPLETLETRTMMSGTLPNAPTDVTITELTPTSVNVTWTENTPSAAGYIVLRSANGKSFSKVGVVVGDGTLSFTDNSVAPHTAYAYKIEAFTSLSTSKPSPAVTIVTPPVAPSGLSANISAGSVILKWKDNDTTAGSYTIYRKTNNQTAVAIGTVTGVSSSTYTDRSISDGNSYTYEVEAVKQTTVSPFSNTAAVVTPLVAPSKLTAVAQSSAWIHLSWTDNDSSAAGYVVLRSTDGKNFSTFAMLTGVTTNSFDDKSVSPFTTYYYQVQATTAAVTSATSGIVNASTPMATPTWSPASVNQSSIKLSWVDSDPAATGFVILQSTKGGTSTQIAQIASGQGGTQTNIQTNSWTDKSFTSNTQYSFEVEATHGNATSPMSLPVTVTTPVMTPTGLTVVPITTTSVKLSWTNTDSSATEYIISRSTNGGAFTSLATVTGGTVSTYTDTTVSSGHVYAYQVIAATSTNQSAPSASASVTTPLAAPTSLSANISAGGVALSWTDQDTNATGYLVLRSTDGVTYQKLTSISGATVNSYTDTTTLTAHTYYYQVQSTNSNASSSVGNAASVTIPLLTPTGLTATVSGQTISLTWTDKDTQATGFAVQRSTDGVTFTQLATTLTTSYTDTTATAGQKYYYQVNATAPGFTSPVSTSANATVPATPTPAPASTVQIATRYTSELTITATGSSDSVSVNQSGSTLTIVADGQTITDPAPANGLFIYTRGGTDSISLGQGVSASTTVETIDTGTDTILNNASHITIWDDSSDIVSGTGTATVHTVNTFAGGVAKSTGASLADPKDAGSTMKVTGSLFGSGPTAADINQGQVGDCYFMSSLAAFAGQQPGVLEQSAVDMGDGTYVVKFMSGTTPTYVRVNNDISTYGGGSYVYAHPGSSGDLWGVVMEKAFAYFRTGANTYSSINSGWMGEVYGDLGVSSTALFPNTMTQTSFYNLVSAALAAGKEVTFGTGSSAPQLVSGHAYTLISCSISANGTTTYVVRNPWGVSGDSLENSQGYATLTFAQVQANFYDGCVSA